MFKNVLKFTVVILVLLCLVAVPVFGVSFYDSPSIFSENVFFTNRQLGQGTSAYLTFKTTQEDGEDFKIDTDKLTQAAETLAARFKAVGYSDIVTEAVENDQIRADIAQTSFIDSLVSQLAGKGEWSFVNPSQEVVCDASMVESAEVRSTSNGYYIRLHFTEEGAKTFESNCASLAASSSSAYFYVDEAFASIISFSNVKFGDTFTFGNYNGYGFSDYATAALYAAFINDGALPADMEIASVEPLAPTTPASVIIGLNVAFIAVFLVFTILLLIKGRTAGLFAAASLLGDICVMLIFMVNGAFQVNIATVITLLVCLILAGVFALYAATPCGKLLKDGKMLSSALQGPVRKANIKALWIHALLFFAAIICWLFIRGSAIYVIMAVMIASLTNLASYFVLFYFPTATLANTQQLKKK